VNDAIMALLKFGMAFFLGVCILMWAFQPGHTWVYFVIFAFIGTGLVYWATKSHKLWLLALLLILALYLWKSSSIDDSIQSVGRSFPQKAVRRGTQGAEKYFKSKEPYAAIRKAVETGTKIDQNDINQCLRDVVTDHAKTDPTLVPNGVTCAKMTGKEFQTCMENHVFTADAEQSAVIDAAQCSGASSSAPPTLARKIGNLGEGAAVTAACAAAELFNYFPWVNLDTSKCPE
jgi:hypothetical protein